MTQPFLALITPLTGSPGQPDNSLPGGGLHPGNRPPGSWGGPVDPGYGQDGGLHPGNRPPGSWGGPVDPGFGGGTGEHPGNRPPGSGAYPSQPIYHPDKPTPPGELPEGGTPVDDYQPEPPPEDIYSQYVISVWNPKTASWTTKSYPPR